MDYFWWDLMGFQWDFNGISCDFVWGIHGDKGSFHTDISDLCVVFIAIGWTYGRVESFFSLFTWIASRNQTWPWKIFQKSLMVSPISAQLSDVPRLMTPSADDKGRRGDQNRLSSYWIDLAMKKPNSNFFLLHWPEILVRVKEPTYPS